MTLKEMIIQETGKDLYDELPLGPILPQWEKYPIIRALRKWEKS